MHSSYTFFSLAALVSLAQGHLVILNAQGLEGSNASVAFAVDPAVARNCTLINPCQLDTTIIREAEIKANLVNLCGRTQLGGNIDIAFNTEAALAAGTVTQVKKGSEIQLTMHQVNADGAGPYECDLDEGSNSSLMEKKLTMVSNIPGMNGVSQAMATTFNITVKMPDDFTCYGASPGNICTVRCRNNAVAGPFGGCFAVQQVDVEPTVNTAANVMTFKNEEKIVNELKTNLESIEMGKVSNSIQGIVDQAYNAAHANNMLEAVIQSNTYPQTVQNDRASGAGATGQESATTSTTAAAGTSAATSAVVIATTATTSAKTRATTSATTSALSQAQFASGVSSLVLSFQTATSTSLSSAATPTAGILGKKSLSNGLRWARRLVEGA